MDLYLHQGQRSVINRRHRRRSVVVVPPVIHATAVLVSPVLDGFVFKVFYCQVILIHVIQKQLSVEIGWYGTSGGSDDRRLFRSAPGVKGYWLD